MRRSAPIFVLMAIPLVACIPWARDAGARETTPEIVTVRRGPMGSTVDTKGVFVPERREEVKCQPRDTRTLLEVVEAARSRGIPIVVGAQVGETSLLTRAALTIASAAPDLLVGQEGAFGSLLLEADVCDPPLMFGEGGVLRLGDAQRTPGFGLDVPADLRFLHTLQDPV